MPISDFSTNFDVQAINIEPYVLIDQVSPVEFIIGTSRSFSDTTLPNWRIKQIILNATVWVTGYPNGDQNFKFIWEDRAGYTYK
jgi:hypothetical protein